MSYTSYIRKLALWSKGSRFQIPATADPGGSGHDLSNWASVIYKRRLGLPFQLAALVVPLSIDGSCLSKSLLLKYINEFILVLLLLMKTDFNSGQKH